MFATLLGDLPRPPLPADAPAEAIVRAVLEAQEAAGLEPVTDGGWWGSLPPITAWQRTSALTDRLVKQAMDGPYSAVAADPASHRDGSREHRDALTAAARIANAALLELAAAGCPMIEVREPGAVSIGPDRDGWELFREAHLVMTAGVVGTHLSLAITGGAVDPMGLDAIVSAPYASLAVDLIAGPDSWRLVRAMPGERGIVCGALSPSAVSDDGPETLLWAAAYAASSHGRGPDRVGIASASSFARLPWDVAAAKLRKLGEAAQLAALPAEELRSRLDPRSIDIRSAALGRTDPARSPRPTGPTRDRTPPTGS